MDQVKKGKVDTTAVNELLKAYENYAQTFPNDTLGANYLFRAADFYKYMRKPMRSIALYEKIYDNYPTFSKHAYSLFLQGFIFENEVHNYDSARVKYELFLKEFPGHPIARDIKITLDNLGKSADQLMQGIPNPPA